MQTFYLDENVSLKIVPFVVAAGYTVITYLDEGLKGERDDVHLFTARRNDWILVTYNRAVKNQAKRGMHDATWLGSAAR